ncbi:hypothetical protein KIN20_026790 [Parelaphostrongylus tenuis]|uniref:Epg5-like central TPR repeats domain-containing protein n=1 Tax=Parelaphostrongylus tenuis TaxID=148309 RepID=A0AAD5QYG2_PARTN|nr:hypothetical protein KIN20_026790 [Parelaphostrongylus tenuis]
MYSMWGRYLECITRLAQLFLFITAREAFPSDAPSTIVQTDFARVFQQIVNVFSPLIAPVSSSLPPFSPSNEREAHIVLERLVQLLTVLPHNASLKPGTQNLPSLVWQFYFEKLSMLSQGSSHYFSTIESHFVRIPWAAFYPSQRGLTAMDECLATKSPHCAPFVGQVVVRVLWKDVLTYHVESEVVPQYLSTLYSVLVRIGSSTSNYIKVRASLLDLVKSLSDRGDWSTISPESVEELAQTVAVNFPHNSLTNPTDVVAVLHMIWRKTCCFIVREPFTSVALLKQTVFLRTECSLLLREGATAAPPAYNSLIADVNSVAQQHENLRAFSVVARELTVLWSRISDTKFGESLVTTWNAYLDANYESPLVLMSLNTLIGSLNVDQVVTALKVLEKTYAHISNAAKGRFEFHNKSYKQQKNFAFTTVSFPTLLHLLFAPYSPLLLRMFTIALQLACDIYNPRAVSHTTNDGRKSLPRATEGAAVLNSRINALKEVAATKVINLSTFLSTFYLVPYCCCGRGVA